MEVVKVIFCEHFNCCKQESKEDYKSKLLNGVDVKVLAIRQNSVSRK